MAAGAAGTTTPPPLRLKDLLELDCDSCSAAGFQCYPRRLLGESSAPAMRRLLSSQPSLRRHPSKKLSHLSRSLSRRLGKGGLLWRRRDEDDEDDACAAAAPSGGGSESSGASSSSEATTSGDSSGRRGSRCESDSDFSTATSTSSSTSDDAMDAAAAAAAVNHDATGDEHEAMKRSGSEPDDKEEQLSPVAVMDFPSDDDDGERDLVAGACSPSFSLARLQRRKKMLRPQHKIRQFGSTEELGPVVDLETLMAATLDSDTDDIVEELGPVVDLETLMAATSSDSDSDDITDDAVAWQQVFQCRIGDDAAATAPRPSIRNNCHGAVGGFHHDHETHEHDLLHLLMDAASAWVDHVSERLLFDFFVEMKRRRGSMEHTDDVAVERLLPREDERLGDGEVLATAKRWLDDGAGRERWGLNDVLRRGGEAVVAEMERPRRWMQVGEEEREVGAVVAGLLTDQLVDEMMWDLLV